jgi:hypothetical protein
MSEQINASRPMYRPSLDGEQGLEPGTMRLIYLAGFGGLAILAGIAVYSLTGRSGGGDTLPVVSADPRPIRVKPENPGGMQIAPETKASDPSQSRLAPGTEEPNPHALMAIPDPSKLPGTPPAPPRAKQVTVQLSAVKSEADAQATWDKLTKKMPEVLGQHRPLYQKTDDAGPAPWRLRTSGFTDQTQAKAFCEKVKAKGGQCALVDS